MKYRGYKKRHNKYISAKTQIDNYCYNRTIKAINTALLVAGTAMAIVAIAILYQAPFMFLR